MEANSITYQNCCMESLWGLEEIDDDIWQIYFSHVKLGILNLNNKVVRQAYKSTRLTSTLPMILG